MNGSVDTHRFDLVNKDNSNDRACWIDSWNDRGGSVGTGTLDVSLTAGTFIGCKFVSCETARSAMRPLRQSLSGTERGSGRDWKRPPASNPTSRGGAGYGCRDVNSLLIKRIRDVGAGTVEHCLRRGKSSPNVLSVEGDADAEVPISGTLDIDLGLSKTDDRVYASGRFPRMILHSETRWGRGVLLSDTRYNKCTKTS